MELNKLSKEIHEAAVKKGFYEEKREVGTLLMLCVSELSEALEADRKDKHANIDRFKIYSGYKPTDIPRAFEDTIKDTFEDEIADTMIRLLDMCGYFKIDIEKHIELKLEYNATRPFKHGKKY